MKNINLLIISVLLLSLAFAADRCQRAKIEAEQAGAAIGILKSNQVKLSQDAAGRYTALKEIAQLDRKKFIEIDARKDAQLANLQALVKQVGKRAASGTAFRVVTVTRAVGAVDSIYVPRGTIQPTYFGTVHGFGYHATIEAGPDSIRVVSETLNDLAVVVEETGGLFKKRRRFVHVKSFNPDSRTTEAQSFEVPPNKNSGFLYFFSGLLLGGIGGKSVL